MAIDLIARAMAANGGGGGTPTDAYSKTETDALLKNKVGFAEYKDNKISFYNSILKDNIIGEIDLPVDMVVDQIKTKFSQKFKFDETTYPDTENPNLDGKPVLVLAIKTSATADTFSFLNMESLVDVYTGGTTKSAIISVDPETGVITNVVRISAETGNRIVQKDDGLFVPNQSASDVSYSNTTSKLKATTTQAAIDETLNVANEKYIKPSTGIPSADMAQSVKDSLAKADTALQEADKTELQGEIDDKLDKTAVLSDFSSEDLTNKVPSAQLVLDSFTKKVITEAVDNNTRIITVPEDVDCFGSVAMIGGKTVKFNQLIDATEKVVTPTVQYVAIYESVNDVISNNNGHIYYVSTFINGGVRVQLGYGFWTSAQTTKIMANSVSTTYPTKFSMVFKNDISSSSRYIYAIETATSDFKKITMTNTMLIDLTVMFGAGKEPTKEQCDVMFSEPYYPQTNGVLWNTPVKKVVLEGKNLLKEGILTAAPATSSNPAIKLIGNTSIQPLGVPTTTYSQYSTQFNLEPGTYTFTVYSPENKKCNCNIRGYKNGTYVGLFSAPDTNTPSVFTITGGEGYEHYVVAEGFTKDTTYDHPLSLILERGSEYTGWVDSNKTTISLDAIVNNLPGYGLSVGDVKNEIDFENGVYYYNIDEIDLKDIPITAYIEASNYYQTNTNVINAVAANSKLTSICDKFESHINSGVSSMANFNYTINGDKRIIIKLTNITSGKPSDANDYIKSIGGAKIVYELTDDKKKIIDIASIIPPIHVEPNGTIEFVNEHNLDVPTKTIYKKTI